MAVDLKTIPGKKPMRHKKKRILFYSMMTLVLTLLVFDLYCEIYSLPSSIEKAIEGRLREKGILVTIGNARAGIFHGIVLDDVTIRDSVNGSFKLFTAESIRFRLPLSFKKVYMDKFSIHGGTLKLPLFPEAGDEGLTDVLTFQNIEAMIEKDGDNLEIIYATTLLNGFLLNISGEVREVFSDGRLFFQSADGLDQETIKPSASLSLLPLNARSYFMNELKNIKRISFSKMPLLQLHLSLGMKDISSSTMECRLKIPSFKFRNYMVDAIDGNLSLKDKNLHLEGLSANLGKNGQLKATGDLDLSSMVFKGILNGKLALNKYLRAEDADFLENIKLPDGLSEFEVLIGSYAILAYNGSIRASISIPAAEAYKVPLKDIKLNAMVSFDEKEKTDIHIEKAKISFNDGEFFDFSGDINRKTKILSGNVSGSAVPPRFLPLLDEKTRSEIDQLIKLSNEPLSFSGRIGRISPDLKMVQAEISINLPSLRIYDSTFIKISTRISMDGKTIKASGIEASTPQGNKIDGEIEYYMPDDHFYISLHSTGNPEFVHKSTAGRVRVNLQALYDQFIWPEKNELIEMTARMNFFMKKEPIFNLVGNIVVSDFSYNNVHFDYGASAFYVDSDFLSLLPRIILQQGKDSALISLAYDNRQGTEMFPVSESFNVPGKATDKLYFDVDSTLPGNSILKCIVPGWNNTRLNLSGTSPLKVSGMIDFVDTENTFFDARLTDAQGEWSGIPMKDIKAAVSMKKEILDIKDVTAEVFDGDVIFSYNYNLKDNTGKIALSVEDSEFAPLVKNLGFTDFSTKKIGSLSGDMLADLSYNEKDELLMDGKGKISLKDADIMDIPVLKGFTDLLGKSVISSEWGEISSADCNFTLEKDHFFSDSIQTNGNAVALSADGKYYWTTSETDFRVRAKILKNILPYELLSKLMEPLSWALEARLYGKGKDLKWEQISTLKKLFK
ncbi:MAG TPA: hypothetical protein DET40_00570 [Lentisphaeria bacterium]|nr:MAG: hypothetical protein A2X45_05195 [Lentisphaerae bacterium GWF2_50_93]HCE42026.1 hypothetical protein [Lentisphaeria bacterium]